MFWYNSDYCFYLFEDTGSEAGYWVCHGEYEYAWLVGRNVEELKAYIDDPSIGIIDEIIPGWILKASETTD